MKILANILIIVASIIWVIEIIPQIVKIMKEKEVSGLSLSFFSMSLIAYVLYIIGNAMLYNWVIVLGHIPSAIGVMIVIYLILRYKDA